MILTSAGQLPCRAIVHVVGQSNPADIKNTVYSVLKLCEEQKFQSVAFPALGTGVRTQTTCLTFRIVNILSYSYMLLFKHE